MPAQRNADRAPRLSAAGLAVLVAGLACNMAGITAPTPAPPEAVTPMPVTPQPAVEEPTATSTPTLTPTPTPLMPTIAPIESPAGGAPPGGDSPAGLPTAALTPTVCEYGGSFYEDVTIPDGTQIEAGTSFEKMWRLFNDGCRAWESGIRLVYDGGAQMSGPGSVAVPPTAPNGLVEVGVTLTAPQEPGRYRGYWQLQAPDGTRFGPRIFVDIVSVAPGAVDAP